MNINRRSPDGNLALPGFRKHHPTTEDEVRQNRRLKLLKIFPKNLRKHIVAFIGEFVGTFMFLFFAFAATQVANAQLTAETDGLGPKILTLLYISLAFGFSLLINVWVFYRITGGIFNPAVSLMFSITR